MSPIYKSVIQTGDIVAFWERNGELWLFSPASMRQKSFHIEMEEWKERRRSYPEEELAKYDDIINAAWHFSGQHLEFIDKSRAVASTIEPGIYYPRIWRGYRSEYSPYITYDAVEPRAIYGRTYTQSTIALASLFDYLGEIFKYVEPAETNYAAFSHKIRELLILACTEIESNWRAVLEDNLAPEKYKKRYSTNDYIMIKEPLNLERWSVALTDYTDLGEFAPFKTWSSADPTASLPWYNSYNAIKHHREAEFTKATLLNLLNAMGALYIMSAAQWGPEPYGFSSSPFSIAVSPVIPLADVYMPSLDGHGTLTKGLYFER